jgi:hypothetical protein
MSLAASIQIADQDINSLTTTPGSAVLGQLASASDGRKFRYVQFGGTSTITSGKVVTAPVITASTAGFQGMTITAVGTGGQVTANLALGSTTLVLSNTGATAITSDMFAGGYLDILVGALGITSSYSYKVRGNSAAVATSGYVTVYLQDPLRNTTALVAGTDTANLQVSPYSAVNTSSTAALVVGVTVCPVPNTATVTNYGWVQVEGPSAVINDANAVITVGGAFAQSTTTAGAVITATASTLPIIGYARVAMAQSAVSPVYLKIS